ncbi:MAG: 3-phosphoshikimate 1-carboxyvinyltransferase, partial [Acidobacteria bacterium]|nr:3-phosphoshikimate 1-carboxyvinyltransferase [Acidobacteriota bacterium]
MQMTVQQPRRLRGDVTPPGDKSISHRAAIFNAIADGEARVENYGTGADLASTLRVLRGLGTQIERHDDGAFTVRGGILQEPSDVLNTGNSGTTTRLMAGVLAGQPFMTVMTGDRSIRSRPMARIVEPLRLMGADVDGRDGGRLAPLTFRGGSLHGIEYSMPVASAQVKSALLLAGLFAEGETTLEQPAVSRDHTELMFRSMGVEVIEDGLTVSVRPGRLSAMDVTVPADISSAAYWLVAGVCHPDSEVRVLNVGVNPTRTGILDALAMMGADVTVENERTEGGELVADLVARSSNLRAAEIGGDLIPRLVDEVPVLALAACFAEGTTVIRDASELRVKESDRLMASRVELSRMGAEVEELDDGLRITGGRALSGATHRTYADHRIAMTMGVAGLIAAGGTTVQSAQTAAGSYPPFWGDPGVLGGGAWPGRAGAR